MAIHETNICKITAFIERLSRAVDDIVQERTNKYSIIPKRIITVLNFNEIKIFQKNDGYNCLSNAVRKNSPHKPTPRFTPIASPYCKNDRK